MITDKEKIEKLILTCVKRDVNVLYLFARNCGLEELHFLLGSIHLHAMKSYWSDRTPDATIVHLRTMDAFRYLISVVSSVSGRGGLHSRVIDMKLIETLIRLATIINSMNEQISSLYLLSRVEFDPKTNQIRSYLEDLKSDEEVRKINDYCFRVQSDVESLHDLKPIGAVLEEVISEFKDMDFFFQLKFGVTSTAYLDFVNSIVSSIQRRLDDSFHLFSYDETDLIDPTDPKNCIQYSKLTMFTREELIALCPRGEAILNSLCLPASEFDPLQLKYDLFSVKPIVRYGSHFIVNTETLMGALKDNVHYEFLKDPKISEEYKALLGSRFEEKIIRIAERNGYSVYDRKKDLFIGKRPIGDIDIILKSNIDSRILCVEAKCHSLSSEVQAHDPRFIKSRLKDQRKEWEAKVKLRGERYTQELGHSNFNYIIVTKKPEPLSHFSDLVVLSLKEFEIWIQGDANSTFEELSRKIYTRAKLKEDTLRRISPTVRAVKL